MSNCFSMYHTETKTISLFLSIYRKMVGDQFVDARCYLFGCLEFEVSSICQSLPYQPISARDKQDSPVWHILNNLTCRNCLWQVFDFQRYFISTCRRFQQTGQTILYVSAMYVRFIMFGCFSSVLIGCCDVLGL